MQRISGPIFKVSALAGLLLLAACTSLITPKLNTDYTTLRAGQYKLDKSHATVLFKVSHLGFSKYIGRFNELDATLDFDPQNFMAARLEAVVQTASVDVNDPDFEETLRGPGWFDSTSYPQAVLRTTSAEKLNETTTRFRGDFTLHGVTIPLDLDITFIAGATNPITGRYVIGFSATATVRRSEHGIAAHVPAVGDEVELEIHAEFQRQ